MTNQQPLTSIGLPLYNGEAYLAETLRSLVSQSYTNLEIVVVDNASTDSSIDICQTYALRDKRVRIHRNRKKLDAARNFNLAAALASGKYFKWVAHHDLLKPTAIERCVDVLESHPEVILAYPRTILVDSNGDVIEYHEEKFHLTARRPHVRLRGSFRASGWSCPLFGLVRRAVLAKTALIGHYPSSDKVLLSELAIRGQCFEVPEHLALRRIHDPNVTIPNQTDEEMATWFNPNREGLATASRVRRILELNGAIKQANLSTPDAILCRLELVRFGLAVGRVQGPTPDLAKLPAAPGPLQANCKNNWETWLL